MDELDRSDDLTRRILGDNLERASLRMAAGLFLFSLVLALLLKL